MEMVLTLWYDLRYGFRALRRNPGFALAAVLTLALGIGANTAIFTIVDAVLLRPLPYRDADRLVFVWSAWPAQGINESGSSVPDYHAWRDRTRTLESLAGYWLGDVNLSGSGTDDGVEAERVQAARITANLWHTLGVAPALGRTFMSDEETFGRHQVAIISDGLWHRRFGGVRTIVGQTVQLSGQPHTIVGVMPPGLPFFDTDPAVDVWTPLSFRPGDGMATRGNHFVTLVGRLRPGVDVAAARREFASLAAALQVEFWQNKGLGTAVALVHEQLTRDVREALLLLLGAVGFVLLVACVNVANLLLARAAARQKELAIRASLGAGRAALIRQLTLEGLPLGLLGGAAALLVATWSLRLLSTQLPATLPRFNTIGLNGRVLLFTGALAIVTALLFGLLPALQATRRAVTDVLNEGGRSGGGGLRRTRLRGALVVAEIALALVLLVGSGLMLRSFARLRAVDLGFARDHLVTLRIPLPAARYPMNDETPGRDPAALAWYGELLRRVRALPGVTTAGVGTALPLGFGDRWGKYVTAEGQPAPRTLADVPLTQFALVSSGYFEAVGLGLRRGRLFSDRDTRDSQPVAIVNEAFVRRYFPDRDPIGRTVRMLPPDELLPGATDVPPADRAPLRVIVGVVASVKAGSLRRDPPTEVYAPYTQHRAEGWSNALSLVVRSATPPQDLVRAVRAEIRALDPDQPITDVMTADQMIGRRLSQPRFSTLLLGLFAGLGVLLAAVGIFGVIAQLVALRTHEVGVRVALGAQRRDVLRLVLGEGLRLTLIGIALGWMVAALFAPLLRAQLYGVRAIDLPTFASVAGVLAVVALLACYLPARRAARIDPIVALRHG